MKFKKVTRESCFYNEIKELALEAFPKKEYLSPDTLLKMAKNDNFDFYEIIDKEMFIGFLAVQTYKDLCYLFFLAISKKNRFKGYGSKTLELLKNTYKDKKLIVDIEMPDCNSLNYMQRRKRKEFYLKNGYKETNLFLSYLGVDYEVLCMNDDFNEYEFKNLMQTINVKDFNPKYFKK